MSSNNNNNNTDADAQVQTWVQANWRPYSAVVYIVINLFDFIAFPILNWMYAFYTDTPLVQWSPLTLQGAGLFHLSFGALLTATSISKTNERIKKALS